ncbi:preprotein translocase subunit SecG [Pseudoduganella chitinolytica]|uniref:Protein-export membrane protein SecG n=1 Tax=Pseudoduganella chitinolytica TaxID=34070 RepID=A0ABY8BE24_9BURK|nr:preprotein translocase subunit SecG [Pseudoduganella chitinolytica]WEF33638.1 preprotein translocase subunit SecG [Pseudoduganella chitinolytica]
MNTLFNLVVVVQVLSALAIIALVLLQHGKGADMGAAFGSGASGSLFGATGSSNFMSKSTAFAAAIFFAATLGLSALATQRATGNTGVLSNITAPVSGSAAIPGAAAPAQAPAAAPAAPAAQAPAAGTPAAPAAGAANGAPANQIPK